MQRRERRLVHGDAEVLVSGRLWPPSGEHEVRLDGVLGEPVIRRALHAAPSDEPDAVRLAKQYLSNVPKVRSRGAEVDANAPPVFFKNRDSFNYSAYMAGWGASTGELSNALKSLAATPDRAKFDWHIRGPAGAEITLTAKHDRAGVVRHKLVLGR